jgi:hypothetical protein
MLNSQIKSCPSSHLKTNYQHHEPPPLHLSVLYALLGSHDHFASVFQWCHYKKKKVFFATFKINVCNGSTTVDDLYISRPL